MITLGRFEIIRRLWQVAGLAAQGSAGSQRLAALAACRARYGAVGAVHPVEWPRADMCGRASVCVWYRRVTHPMRPRGIRQESPLAIAEATSLKWHCGL